MFSSLATMTITRYLAAHAATATRPATVVEATLAAYHLVFRLAAGVFAGTAVLAALLFRSGPLPVHAPVTRTPGPRPSDLLA